MSDAITESGDPLQVVDTYSGKLYWLNPPSGTKIDLNHLNEKMKNRTFQHDISDQFEDADDLIIPQVFEQDGTMVKTTTTDNVGLVEFDHQEVICGDIVLDSINEVSYRDKKILMMNTTSSKFLIFRQGDHHYLAILSRRELAEGIVSVFRDQFTELGSIINKTRLTSDSIGCIRESLDAVLMDTIITDYDQTEISLTRIRGEDYQDTSVYERMEEGKVKSHMFQSDDLVSDQTKTISIGRDGLVRIYSNATLRTYLELLKEYVVPEVHRDASSSPSVGAWESVSDDDSSIFVQI